MYAATTRADARGEARRRLAPEQRLTLAEAVSGFTAGAAYAEFAEDTRGAVRVGAAASLTVFAAPLDAGAALLDATVVATIVDGDVVYAR
ncbi:MAG: amidohydrolase family protein [Kofleriaceae bacterium]